MLVKKKPHVALNNTSSCLHHVLDNFITFHFRALGRNHIVSVPFEAMEIPCFVIEHWDSSCPLQSRLGHKQAHTQAQAQGQAKAHTPLLLPNFFFCLSCSLSALFLFCNHAVQKKKLNYFKFTLVILYAYCHFIAEQQWKRTSVHFSFTSSPDSILVIYVAGIILLFACFSSSEHL